MNRLTSPLVILAAATLVAACGTGIGGLGSIAPASPSPEQSLPQGSPDATPGRPSGSPAGSPAATPGSSPSTPAGPGTSQPPAGPPAPATPSPTPPPAGTTIVRAYFYLGGDEATAGLVAVLREVPRTQAVGRAAMEALLAGPRGMELADGSGISSIIPPGTRLLGLSIASGTATVDLSGEFQAGGGSAGSFVRLAQVVYTLTQFPTVERVMFRIDGRDVDVFGSEGIVLDGPQTRDDYVDALPSIWVDRPAWGAALENPARIAGSANVFEAQFHVAILDTDGQPIVDEPVMATCGSGCRGTWDVTLPYDVPEAGWGALRTYNLSARDGSVEMVRDYPVWLTPAR